MTKYTRENIELQCRRLLANENSDLRNEIMRNSIGYTGLAKAYIMACDEIHELKGQLQNDEWEEATASKKEIVAEEKLTTDNYKRLQRFGYEGAKFERIKHEDPNNILFRNWEDEVVIYEESGKIKGKIWEIKASTKDFDYISIEDLDELEFEGE